MEKQRNITAGPSSSNQPSIGNRAVTRSRSSTLPENSRNQQVYDNLMKGKASANRSRKSQDNDNDVPEPVIPTENTVKTTHEQVQTIQQVCEQENETIRQQVKGIQDQVTNLSCQQQQTHEENQVSVINALRNEMNEKFEELVQAQPDVSKLVQELFTLRRDTNNLLEAQSTLKEGTNNTPHAPNQSQQQPVEEPMLEEEQVSVLNNLPSRVDNQRQSRTQAENQSRSTRTTRKTTTQSFIRNRRYDSSSGSESDDLEDFTEDRQYNQQEHGQAIPFFARKKGPLHEGITIIKPSDPVFDRLMNYRYYRLADTRQVRSAEDTKRLRDQAKTFQSTFDTTKFSGEDPIMVFDFLMKFVEEADTLNVSEAHAFIILPKVLKGRAERWLRSVRNGSRSGGVTCWPEAVNSLLRTYATSSAIRNAVNNLRNIRQQPREEEMEYSGRLNDAAHRCGNVYDEIDKMTFFVNGLLPSIQTIVARYRESQSRRDLSYEELVQFAQDEGDSHRARTSNLRVAKIVSNKNNDKVVHFMEPSIGTSNDNNEEEIFIVDNDGSIPTDELPSTDNSSQQSLFYTNDHRRNTKMVRPKALAYGTPSTSTTRPGWETKQEIICHTCYVVGQHISPNCTAPVSDMQRIIVNYNALSDEQKTRVPDNSYKLAKQYTEMKRELSSMDRETVNNINDTNETVKQDPSKN